MNKFGITILCHDTDGTTYVDTINKLFNTKEQAQEQISESITDELETLGDTYERVGDTIENAYSETISEYQIWEYELDGHKTNLRESLYLDFKQALDETEFGNEQKEDDTYQYLIDQLDIQYRAKSVDDISLTIQDIASIISILNETTISFREALGIVVDFLGKGE